MVAKFLDHSNRELKSTDEGGGNENGKKEYVYISKTTTLHLHYAFLYISWPSLQEVLRHETS